ncbi:mobile element protein [Bosea sp. BIWAKO-01]|nr:mobile element protein [Bosea sp. BIWAKO-01]
MAGAACGSLGFRLGAEGAGSPFKGDREPYRRPNTSKRGPELASAQAAGHAAKSGLAMDITYIPMALGSVYLTAVVDWFSRRVLAWRLSITIDVAFYIGTVEEAMARHGKPDALVIGER